MNTWKANLEETKKRYTDWWNHKGVVLNMWEHFQNGVKPHAEIAKPQPPKDLNQKWFDPQWRAEYLDWYVAHSCLKADMLPVANTQLGPGSLAAILGGVFEGGEDTIWIHPNPNYTDEIVFDENNPNWLLHKALLKACKEKAQGHYYVGMPDLMEGLDVLAAIKGTDKVLLDTVMQPEVLERQMQQINDIYFKVFDELYDIIREGDEMAFCYFSSWAPGKMSKLQCDISTMINTDDYRRFVQPFIREQCQKIDYTLYHLDGVGATHHLPALLEIKELNAIQWTPGVGEPQGGSPKWYDLYKQILNAGKGIMACWVTVDELEPLLDNIGTDGVHLEMDFHSEEEVERAMEIVERKKQKNSTTLHSPHSLSPALPSREGEKVTPEDEVNAIINKVEDMFNKTNKTPSLEERGGERLFLLDGATGTMVQALLPDYSGTADLLNLSNPAIVEEIHRRYLDAGADIITTNTFSSQRISMKENADKIRQLNLAGARIARKIADEYTAFNSLKPRYVAGSIGPTNKMASVEGHGTYTALRDAYREQIEALIEGGVDIILVETIFDMDNAEAACEAAVEAMKAKGKKVEIMLSMTIANAAGKTMAGHSMDDMLRLAEKYDAMSVGMNCSFGAEQMVPFLRELSAKTSKMVSAHPNAGLPDATGRYNQSPDILAREIWTLIENHQLNIVGGCCGTNDMHIKYLARLVEPMPGLFTKPKKGRQIPVLYSLSPTLPSREGDIKLSQESSKIITETPKTVEPEQGKANKTSLPTGEGRGEAVEASAVAPSSVFAAIVAGKADDAAEATKQAVAAGAVPQEIINGQMITAMSEVGQRFQDGKAFVPQLLMAGRAMKAALELLKPMLAGEASSTIGKVVIGTVKGDLHDIGKNLVASMLEGCGFEVINIGIDVSAEKFVEEIKKNNADILCMSALLTTTMTYMKDVIKALEEAGIRNDVKVMVGGAPVSQGFADEIGADGYSDNANSAVAVAKGLMNPSPALPERGGSQNS